MTTRSGTNYKAMEEQNTHAEGTPAEGPTTTGNSLLELSSLMEMVRIMIEGRERREREIALEREQRDREIAEERQHRDRERADERERIERQREDERRRYTEESERRIQDMHRQMERLQQLVTEQSAAASSRPRNDLELAKLTRLTENDDIEAYLKTFKRIMEAHEVNRERWSFKLAHQLTGKAQQAYAALPPDNAKSYEAVKVAILRRYNINEETYRKQFCKLRPKEGESPQELMTQGQCLAGQATRPHRERIIPLNSTRRCMSVRDRAATEERRGSKPVCRKLRKGPLYIDHSEGGKDPNHEVPDDTAIGLATVPDPATLRDATQTP